MKFIITLNTISHIYNQSFNLKWYTLFSHIYVQVDKFHEIQYGMSTNRKNKGTPEYQRVSTSVTICE